METAIVLLNFGEPAVPEKEVVREYLTRIFYDNASLEDAESDEEAWERSRELAGRRLPSLMEEYNEIGGSPLQEQAGQQADALAETLADRGHDVEIYHAMQFMEPLISNLPETLAADEIERVIAVPIYPLCGPSTTVSSIDSLEDAIDEESGFDPDFTAITGWHRAPVYNRLRAEGIQQFVDEEGLDPNDSETAFVFSAHGTPTKYLAEGSRYDQYVDEYCAAQAGLLGIDGFTLGYQNHEARGVEWTQPDVEEVVQTLDADHILVDPVSFVHEQSETLSELDIELAEDAEAAGLSFDRVPIPHDDPAFAGVLADLVEPFVVGFDGDYYGFRPCQCATTPGTRCLCAPFV